MVGKKSGGFGWCSLWMGRIQFHKQFGLLKQKNLYPLCYEAGGNGKWERADPLLCTASSQLQEVRDTSLFLLHCLPEHCSCVVWPIKPISWESGPDYIERIKLSEVQHLINSALRQVSEWPFNLSAAAQQSSTRRERQAKEVNHTDRKGFMLLKYET